MYFSALFPKSLNSPTKQRSVHLNAKMSDVMGKAKYKISNWQQYNQALVNRGSIIFGVMKLLYRAGAANSAMVIEEDALRLLMLS